MITGDNIVTAKAVARRIGILKDDTMAINGDELAALSDEELAANITNYSVFARVSPDDKVRIIKAWQSLGQKVTITGDSIKDSDALSIADIGCVLGDNGAEIAKGNADVIISNHSYMSIVNAIKDSRGIFENIQKAVKYLLSCNISELILYFAGLLIFKMPPLLSVQLLWINLLTDSTPALSLCTEKAEADVMDKPPTALKGKIFDKETFFFIFLEALFMSAIALISYNLGVSKAVGQTMTFLTLGLIQILHSYNIKSRHSLFKTDFKSNKFMNYSSILIVFIIMFLSLTPAGAVFGLTILTAKQFFTAVGLALTILPYCEIIKLFIKR
ncbi:MAG: HAD-IC family P-type ATPase [Clostridia bacterium]|nr:HAD-IC family P-type ATPase [Clostridia bacterium]